METILKRYFDLKKKQKLVETELNELRNEILNLMEENKSEELIAGKYRVRIMVQERREYDDQLLYKSLSDSEMWRLISKADQSKISGLLKINALKEEEIMQTYKTKQIKVLQVDKL